MSRKKLIITAIVLVLILAIGGILAYFTDTETATNNLKLGSVDIQLTEPAFTAAEQAKALDLMPGQTIAKNPTVTNLSTTSPAYVFVKVTFPTATFNGASEAAELYTYTINSGWVEVGSADTTTVAGKSTHVYAYAADANTMTPLAKETTTSAAVFDSVTLKNIIETAGQANSLQGTDANIDVKAYGIQTTGLGNADTAAEIWDLVKNM